ncbi:TRADD-N-associated membrane domain-containing protein [Streptomyces sp. cmx-4-25]|uniref:TRADD-N-associated membrane domain-containing protein n=1 Tax=unclassified Streptomyces TaxID=2593676 RepID=UPI0039806282
MVHIGGTVENINVVSPPSPRTRGDRLAEQRQKFFFDFLQHSLKQAEWTFRLSVWFMAGGAAIILTGALITGGGGALAIHSQRARAHVTEQADRMDVKIDLDHKMETATAFIDRVDDPAVRDRLNSAAAMKALDMQPNPEVMADRLLPEQENRRPGEIEPGGSHRQAGREATMTMTAVPSTNPRLPWHGSDRQVLTRSRTTPLRPRAGASRPFGGITAQT